MTNRRKILSILAVLLLFALFSVFLPDLAWASNSSDNPLPDPVTPEPYPNSDVYPAEIYLPTPADLQLLYQLNIDIDGLRAVDAIQLSTGTSYQPSIATIYITPAQSAVLTRAGLSLVPIPNEGYRSFLAYGPGTDSPPGWPTFSEYVTRMQALADAHPDIVRLVRIGWSVQNRGLYCMEISDNPDVDEYEPEFKYTANHHGDETTGIEMTMRLAELLANSYGTDPEITTLVDKMETWICPIYNPDGYVAGTRYNAHGVDLNRDFPDRFDDPIDDPSGREVETQAFMYFGYAHRFVMGANYHGGAQVLNYPWDAVSGPPYYAPDDALFINFGVGYTSRNTDLWNGGFSRGITRGWQWYMIYGGMQDWAYYYHGEHHVTLEISNTKAPAFTQMDTYWNHNRAAMLWWMEQAMTGMGGLVLDARTSSPLDATLSLVGRDTPNTIRTDPEAGDYHRVISAGTYPVDASADGYLDQSASVAVYSDTLNTHDFYLCPSIPFDVSGTVTDAYTSLPLQATIEFTGSPQTTSSQPLDGTYSINICPYTYTMRVSAPWHYSQERLVVVDQSMLQDFSLLPTPNLSPSVKTADVTQPFPMDVVLYQIRVENIGETTTATVTDTLPSQVTWTGYLTSTQGIPTYSDGQIFWQGQSAFTQPVTITYSVAVSQCLPSGTSFMNLAEFTDGINGIITSKVQSVISNAPPSLPSSPLPPDASVAQPITTTLTWAASTDLNCDTITYDLAFGTSEPPETVVRGLSDPIYDPGPLNEGTTYYWQVIARDGLIATAGPIWSFTTTSNIHKLFLPLTIR